MGVKIGHASKDENNKITGGKAGDQTAREVRIDDYYVHSKGWVLLRCNNATRREKIAEAMEKACKNNQIGYDQNQRSTLFNNIQDKGFDPSKTTKNVEVDCSALVRVCIAYAYGRDRVGDIRTKDLPSALVASGLFTKYTTDKYCKSSDYLRRGDILCTPVKGHVVVVLNDGAKAHEVVKKVAKEAAQSFSSSLKRAYKTTASLNIRNGAGTVKNKFGKDKTVLVVIPKGTVVQCLGNYTTVLSRKWLYVQFTYKNVQYTGFASSKYLTKN